MNNAKDYTRGNVKDYTRGEVKSTAMYDGWSWVIKAKTRGPLNASVAPQQLDLDKRMQWAWIDFNVKS